MSLNLNRLEKVREVGNGAIQARCPACAEGGHDRSGEHLRVYPDGRFGCCVYPKDREHRKRIFALAADASPRRIKVKSVVKVANSGRVNVLGRLGRVFGSPARDNGNSDASDGVGEVIPEARGVRAGQTESNHEERVNSRTLRTPSYSYSLKGESSEESK